MKIKLFLTMIMGLCATTVCAQTWPYQDACETVQVYVRNLASHRALASSAASPLTGVWH